MLDTHDPSNYLLSEIAACDAGLRPNWESWQREHYLQVVLVERAEANAWDREPRGHDCSSDVEGL